MRLKFCSTRGSIPVCDAGLQEFGGNTTCMQITFTDTNSIAVIDAETGLRNRGKDHDDEFLLRMENLCRERFPGAVLAREGMGIQL